MDIIDAIKQAKMGARVTRPYRNEYHLEVESDTPSLHHNSKGEVIGLATSDIVARDWVIQQIPSLPTAEEQEIMEHLHALGYEYIAKDSDGSVYGYTKQPKLDASDGTWICYFGTSVYLNHLYKPSFSLMQSKGPVLVKIRKERGK